MKHHFVFNKPAIHFILLVGIFTFVFLGAEYLFVNMISLSVTEGKTVIAQNYALGASAVGFFLYPAMAYNDDIFQPFIPLWLCIGPGLPA